MTSIPGLWEEVVPPFFHADADYRAHLGRVLTKRALQGKTG
jgi:hypothetical protein